MFKERYRLVDFDYLAAAVAHNETGFLVPSTGQGGEAAIFIVDNVR
jgi:hypothetical protein